MGSCSSVGWRQRITVTLEWKWAIPAAGSPDDNLVSWIKEPSARGKFATYNFNERTTKQGFGQRDEKRLDFFHSAIISPERSSPRRPPPQRGRGRIQNPLIGQRKQAARWKGRMGGKDQKKGSELAPHSESLAAIKGVVSLRPWRSLAPSPRLPRDPNWASPAASFQ